MKELKLKISNCLQCPYCHYEKTFECAHPKRNFETITENQYTIVGNFVYKHRPVCYVDWENHDKYCYMPNWCPLKETT